MGKTTNITEQEALKALSDIEGNPRRDGQDEKTLQKLYLLLKTL